MQLAHVMLTTRIASCKSALQLACDCCIQYEKICMVLIQVSPGKSISRSHMLLQTVRINEGKILFHRNTFFVDSRQNTTQYCRPRFSFEIIFVLAVV